MAVMNKRASHLPWLGVTFAVSVLLMPAVLWFAGMGTEILVGMYLVSLISAHLIALGIGFAFQNKSWRLIFCLCAIALLPPACFGLAKLKDAYYLRFQAVRDRFNDDLADPIPKSVSNLEFVPLEDEFETHLMFRFEISPEDLDKIIISKGFRKIDTDSFRRKDDLFTHANYLPLSQPVTFYICEDNYKNGYTLKVSGDRKKVIFRKEDSDYYEYKYWENRLARVGEQRFIQQLSRSGE